MRCLEAAFFNCSKIPDSVCAGELPRRLLTPLLSLAALLLAELPLEQSRAWLWLCRRCRREPAVLPLAISPFSCFSNPLSASSRPVSFQGEEAARKEMTSARRWRSLSLQTRSFVQPVTGSADEPHVKLFGCILCHSNSSGY